MKIQKREAPLKTKFFLSMCSLTTSVTVLLLIIMSLIFYGHFFSVQAESSALQLNAVKTLCLSVPMALRGAGSRAVLELLS